MKNKFITFEGGEGSGRTTQSKKLFEYLQTRGHEVIWTREIGGNEFAEKIRELVVNNEILSKTELLLIISARNEHIEKIIKPALSAGKYVICDRFIDSTAAYQAENFEEVKMIYELHEILLGNFMPDKTFYMQIDAAIALERAFAGGEINKYERKNICFHEKVTKNYIQIAEIYKDRIDVLNASRDVDSIFAEILMLFDIYN